MTVWTTKDGQEIPLVRLGDQHLLNILLMLERLPEDVLRLTAIANGFQLDCYADSANGDMAEHCLRMDALRAYEATELEDIHPIYRDLVAEAVRRGLRQPPPAEDGLVDPVLEDFEDYPPSGGPNDPWDH